MVYGSVARQGRAADVLYGSMVAAVVIVLFLGNKTSVSPTTRNSHAPYSRPLPCTAPRSDSADEEAAGAAGAWLRGLTWAHLSRELLVGRVRGGIPRGSLKEGWLKHLARAAGAPRCHGTELQGNAETQTVVQRGST